jgi:hypothetical protein
MVERKRLTTKTGERVQPDAKRSKGGRPTLYHPKFAKAAKVLCAYGATDEVLADAFSVSVACIKKWYSSQPEFREAVVAGKSEVFDPLVERTLAQRALGFFMDCEEAKVTKDGDVVRYPIRKYFPPDPASVFFWLKNRQPGKWRDVWKIDSEVKVVDTLTSDQLLDEIRKEAEELGLTKALKAMGVAPTAEMVKPSAKSNGTKH